MVTAAPQQDRSGSPQRHRRLPLLESAAAHPGAARRLDVQGLRALAVLLVMLFHAGVPGFTGGFVGVDVFFVISGFLITGLLVREVEMTGRISLRDFWARRARRILPAACAALLGTLVLTLLLLPPTRWSTTASDVVASAFYVVNWAYAARSVSYLAEAEPVAPVQHFWSLAVEEQFYVLWPLLLVLLVPLLRRRSVPGRRRLLLLAASAVIVSSIVCSIVLTSTIPAAAYFVTPTRLWELAAGAALAVSASRLPRLRPSLAAAIGWAGCAAILIAATTFDAATPFPGVAAVLPVLGAVAVLAGGDSAPRNGPGRVLSMRLATWIGDLSYSLYLWHWPLLVSATWLAGGLNPVLGASVLALTFVPAMLSRRFVERPFLEGGRRWRRPIRTSLALGLACSLAVAAAGGALFGVLKATRPSLPDPSALLSSAEPFGAAAVASGVDRPGIVPDPLVAAVDFGRNCTPTELGDPELHPCRFGVASSSVRVVVLGDSHMRQWIPALHQIAEERGWQVTAFLKYGCPFLDAPVAFLSAPNPECAAYDAEVRKTLAAGPAPDLVVTSGAPHDLVERGRIVPFAASADRSQAALARTLRFLASVTPHVAVIRDTPDLGTDVPGCVSLHRADPGSCSADPTSDSLLQGRLQQQAAEQVPGVRLVDLDHLVCPNRPCAPVLGGVLVYQDDEHLTATYSLSLAGPLGGALAQVLRS